MRIERRAAGGQALPEGVRLATALLCAAQENGDLRLVAGPPGSPFEEVCRLQQEDHSPQVVRPVGNRR